MRAWSTLRKIVLLAVVGYAVLVIAPDTLRLVPPERLPGPGPLNRWYPLGTLGFVADNDGVVTSVEPGGPAWKSCLRKGDKIDLGRTRDRRAVNEMVFVAHGEPVSVYVSKFRDVAADQLGPCVDSRVTPRSITMQPSPETLSWPEWATLLLDQLAGFTLHRPLRLPGLASLHAADGRSVVLRRLVQLRPILRMVCQSQ